MMSPPVRRILFLMFSSGGWLTNVPAQPPLAKLPVFRHSFVLSAHRGDHQRAPENTMAAFANAIADGMDLIEIDLRTTKDSQLVIMHDASVDRMTNGKGLVREMTLDELKKLRVSDKLHPEWGGFEIPTFREVLELSRGKINIYLDFKNAVATEAWKQICEYGMQRQVIVYINQEQQFTDWRRVAPDMPLMISLPDQIKEANALEEFLSRVHVELIDGDFDQYNEEMVKIASRKGVMVFPDIQRPGEAALWDRAIALGINALQTDHPKELIAYLKTKGLR